MYKTQSIWSAYAGTTNFPALKGNMRTDALIIGGDNRD